MEKSGTQFAVDFKPVFSASTIVTFLGKPGIKTKVDFLKKFEPFSEFKPTAQNKNPNPILLSKDDKDIFFYYKYKYINKNNKSNFIKYFT